MHEPLHKLLWLAVLRGVLLRLPPSVVADPDQTANGARFLCAGEGCGAVRAVVSACMVVVTMAETLTRLLQQRSPDLWTETAWKQSLWVPTLLALLMSTITSRQG